MTKRISALAIVLAGVALAGNAAAQEKNDYVVDPDAAAGKKKKDGIQWRINSGATFNLADNRSVIGQIDGTTIAFGFKFDAGLDWFKGPHELRNSMGVAAGVTRTAALPVFVKSQDQIDLESIYLYHFNDWLGAFARVAWSSQLFQGTDVRANVANYDIYAPGANLDAGGDAPIRTVSDNRLALSDPLKPSRFKQSLGIFSQPIKEDPFNLEARIGAGGRETLAEGTFAIADVDDPSRPNVDVKTLSDVLQLGAEATVEVWGQFEGGKVIYKAGVEFMLPFVTNDDTRPATELYNLLMYANLGFKLVDWASIDYSVRVLREEQLLPGQWQIQNQLLLTMGLSAGSASKEAKK